MNANNLPSFRLLVLLTLPLLLTSCAAGDAQFTPENLAGFWYGLWHGVISILSLIIHIFNNDVAVYEINNSGGWYDFGFLMGVICVWGGSSHVTVKASVDKKREKDWDEIGKKVEIKVMRKLKEWAEGEADAGSDEDWDEIGEKVEKKLKRKIREWADKD